MTKSKKDDDIILLSNNDNHTVMLTDLKRVNIQGISKQKNNRMLTYLNLLVDDLYIYNGDFELCVEISISDMHMSIMLDRSYPHYYECIFLYFDLKEKASIQALAKALSNVDTDDNSHWGNKEDVDFYLDLSFGYDHELMLSDYPPMYIEYGRKLMRNIKLVDKAFYFENKAIDTFYQNNTRTYNDVQVNSTSFKFIVWGDNNSMPIILLRSPFIEIKIETSGIEVVFDGNNKFSFTTSDNFKRDLDMLQMITKSFIEKTKDIDVHDLKSEILLLEMEAI